MHFLDAWSGLSAAALARLALPAAFMLLAVLVPGRTGARLAAIGVAVSVMLARDLVGTPPVVYGWTLLWLAIAWQAGRYSAPGRQAPGARLGGLESGTVGLLLAPVLVLLLAGVLGRLDLPPEASRSASLGSFLLVMGLLHLMLHRHAARAALGFAALGLGLQVLERTVRATLVPGAAPVEGALLLGTVVAVGLVLRLARGREQGTGSAWVSDAHDLHD